MKRLLALLLLAPGIAFAQSQPPGFPVVSGQLFTPSQWNIPFPLKVDVTSGTLANPTVTGVLTDSGSLSVASTSMFGGTMTVNGRINSLASTTSQAGLNIPPGAAPTSPINGDVWTSTAGLFARINGTTVGPFVSSGGTGSLPNCSISQLIYYASAGVSPSCLATRSLGVLVTDAGGVPSISNSLPNNIGFDGTFTATGLLLTTSTSGSGSATFSPSLPNTASPVGQQMDSFVYNQAGTAATPAGTGQVYSAITGYSQIAGAQNNFMWGGLFVTDYGGTGGTGQHVAVYGQALRRTYTAQNTTVAATLSTPGTTVSIANLQSFQTYNGSAISSSNPMPILINGDQYHAIGVSGTSGAGTITTSTNVTVADATNGNAVYGVNNPQIWAGTFESTDMTGVSSKNTNAQLSVEFDLKANGLDDSDSVFGSRQLLSVNGVKYNPAGADVEIGIGAGFYIDGAGHYKRIIHLGAPFTVAALSTVYSTQISGNAIWMGDNQTLALDTGGNFTWGYSSSSNKAQLAAAGTAALTMDIGGNIDIRSLKSDLGSVASSQFSVTPLQQSSTIPANNTAINRETWTDVTTGGPNVGATVFNSFFDTTTIGSNTRAADHSVTNGLYEVTFNGGASNAGLRGNLTAQSAQAVRVAGSSLVTTTVASTLGSPGTTLAVSNTAQFQTAQDGGAISSSHGQLILVNGTLYKQTGVSTASGAGNLTFSSNVTVADGTSGNTVQGINEPAMVTSSSQYVDVTGQPSDVTGLGIAHQYAYQTNNLDDAMARTGVQAVILQHFSETGNGALGYPPEVTYGLQLANFAPDGSNRTHIWLGGAYSQAAIDLRQTTSPNATITSATPGSATTTLTVNTIMPFTSAGANFLPTSASNPLAVLVNGTSYSVIGVAFSAPSSGNVTAGGVLTFSGAVTTGDAANGNAVVRPSKHTIWMASNEDIALDTLGNHTLHYDTTNQKLYYTVSGVNVLSVDNSGNVKALGTITPSTTP